MVIEGVILKCLAKNPADRYGNMLELKRDLLSAASNAAFLVCGKPKPARELFKRVGAEQKELNFLRLVFFLSLILLPVSLAILFWGYVSWKFDSIPDGANIAHLEYWSRPFARRKLRHQKRDTALMGQYIALRSIEKSTRTVDSLKFSIIPRL